MSGASEHETCARPSGAGSSHGLELWERRLVAALVGGGSGTVGVLILGVFGFAVGLGRAAYMGWATALFMWWMVDAAGLTVLRRSSRLRYSSGPFALILVLTQASPFVLLTQRLSVGEFWQCTISFAIGWTLAMVTIEYADTKPTR